MKNIFKNKRKVVLIVLSAVVILGVAAGITVAAYKQQSASVTNSILPADVTSEVEETPAGNAKTNVKLRNTGTVDTYLRAKIVINWVKDGQVYGKATPVQGVDYTVSYNLTSTGWGKGADGFYYYRTAVAPGAATAVLINSIKPVTGKAPAGCTLKVDIIGSAIQSKPTSAVVSMWNTGVSSVNGSGLLVLK